MGLDMYLKASRYLSHYDHQVREDASSEAKGEHAKAEAVLKAADMGDAFENNNSVVVVSTIGYWRKANAIHNWFVNNVQDGKDECQEAYVSREQLKELLGICQKVVAGSRVEAGMVNNGYRLTKNEAGQIVREEITEQGKVIVNPELAAELLPTTSGFFFGGTDYDVYYLEGVKHTIEVINRCLRQPKDITFFYQASW